MIPRRIGGDWGDTASVQVIASKRVIREIITLE